MLNTLANHGFLPHNGRGITLDMVKKAMMDGASIAEDISTAAFTPALKTNPLPNANVSSTSFDLSSSSQLADCFKI